MKKQVLVIGLGQFGMSLVRSLSELDAEVIAVDRSPDKVRAVAQIAASVSCIDATNEHELSKLAPERRDVCICAIGDESRESSIICTALLRQLGARLVLSRATDALHERILGLVGAHEIINPENVVGKRVALRVAHEGLVEQLPLGDGLVLTQLEPPGSFIGRSLAELRIQTLYQITVVAVRRADQVYQPTADTVITAGDLLIVVSHPGAVGDMVRKVR